MTAISKKWRDDNADRYVCLDCEYKTYSFARMNTHCESKTHGKPVQKERKKKKVNPKKEKTVIAKKYVCKDCEYETYSHAYISEHFESKTHKENQVLKLSWKK